jgi:hypothetical protein
LAYLLCSRPQSAGSARLAAQRKGTRPSCWRRLLTAVCLMVRGSDRCAVCGSPEEVRYLQVLRWHSKRYVSFCLHGRRDQKFQRRQKVQTAQKLGVQGGHFSLGKSTLLPHDAPALSTVLPTTCYPKRYIWSQSRETQLHDIRPHVSAEAGHATRRPHALEPM